MVYLQETSQCMRVFILGLLFLTVPPLYADHVTDKGATQNPLFFKPPANFSWAGAYIGGYLGTTPATASLETNTGSVTDSSYFSSSADITSVNQSGTNSLSPGAKIIGIQFGDNFFTSKYVTAGIVLDYSTFHLSKTYSANNTAYPSGAGNYSLQTSISTNWLYTVRGRLGFTPPTIWPLMLYATGGLAVTDLKVSNSFNDTNALLGVGASSASNNPTGWTLGVGFEFPVMQHVTINAEYSYLHLGSVSTNGSIQNSVDGFGISANSLANPLGTSVNLHANLFKIGLNYKF
jgi:outer membrane immunogenic protein